MARQNYIRHPRSGAIIHKPSVVHPPEPFFCTRIKSVYSDAASPNSGTLQTQEQLRRFIGTPYDLIHTQHTASDSNFTIIF